MSPAKHKKAHLKESVALKIPRTSPYSSDFYNSKPISRVFSNSGKKFLPNETYYVAAMYSSSQYGDVVQYSTSEMGETPVFVPAGEMDNISPGDEVHRHRPWRYY